MPNRLLNLFVYIKIRRYVQVAPNHSYLSYLSMTTNPLPAAVAAELLDAFRLHYHRFESGIHEAVTTSADTVVLWRLGDDLDQYISLVNEVVNLNYCMLYYSNI